MDEVLSSEDGQGNLKEKLAQGVPGELDTANDKTTKKIWWSSTIESDIDGLVHRPSFWSMTENEMVLTKQAFRKGKQFFKETGIQWINALVTLHKLVKNRSKYQSMARNEVEKAKSSIPRLRFGKREDEEIKLAVHKAEKNRIDKYVSDLGVDTGDLLIVGLSVLIRDNTDLFCRASQDEAMEVLDVAEDSVEGMKDTARGCMKGMGKVIASAYNHDMLYGDDCSQELPGIQRQYPEAMESFSSGAMEKGVTIGELMTAGGQ